jgi:hypothetical protein
MFVEVIMKKKFLYTVGRDVISAATMAIRMEVPRD